MIKLFLHIYTRVSEYEKVIELVEKEYFLNPRLNFQKFLKRKPLHIRLSGIVHYPDMVLDTIALLKTNSNQNIYIIENDLEFEKMEDFIPYVENTLRKKPVEKIKSKTKRLFKKKQKEVEVIPPLNQDDIYKLDKLNELFSLIKEKTMLI